MLRSLISILSEQILLLLDRRKNMKHIVAGLIYLAVMPFSLLGLAYTASHGYNGLFVPIFHTQHLGLWESYALAVFIGMYFSFSHMKQLFDKRKEEDDTGDPIFLALKRILLVTLFYLFLNFFIWFAHMMMTNFPNL